MSSTEFELTIQVPAEEWAYCQRRLTYLETLLLRVVRDEEHIQEWYDAAELEGLALPGLPDTRAGITRIASVGRWPRRLVIGRGIRRYQYHVTVLPRRAFDALIGRILDMPEMEAEVGPLPSLPAESRPEIVLPAITTPPWVLPLMRLYKGEANGDIGKAWRALPAHLPYGTMLPSADEAAFVLAELGLAGRLAQ